MTIALRTGNQTGLELLIKIVGTAKPAFEFVAVVTAKVENNHVCSRWTYSLTVIANQSPRSDEVPNIDGDKVSNHAAKEGWCPGRGSNPYSQRPRDFKSLVSTNFPTRAGATFWAPRYEKGKATGAFPFYFGAAEESRTLDLNLGKVALYQLSYCRFVPELPRGVWNTSGRARIIRRAAVFAIAFCVFLCGSAGGRPYRGGRGLSRPGLAST